MQALKKVFGEFPLSDWDDAVRLRFSLISRCTAYTRSLLFVHSIFTSVLPAQPTRPAGNHAAVHDDVRAGQKAQPLIDEHGEQRGDFLRPAVALQG